MPDQMMEMINLRWSNQADGEIQDGFFFFEGRDRLHEEYEFCISPKKMLEFHLECFQFLFANLSHLDEDLARKLEEFLTAYQTLARLGPEVYQGIRNLNLPT